MSEHDEQKKVVAWWDKKYTNLANCLYANVNSAWLAGSKIARIKQGQKRKAEGLTAGVSDLFLMIPRGGYLGFYIEMKDVGKTYSSVTEPQRNFLKLANEQGYLALWCAGSGKAIEEITKYMDLNDD